MKSLMVLAAFVLLAGVALTDVILGALGFASLCFAGSAALADHHPSKQQA